MEEKVEIPREIYEEMLYREYMMRSRDIIEKYDIYKSDLAIEDLALKYNTSTDTVAYIKENKNNKWLTESDLEYFENVYTNNIVEDMPDDV